MRVLKVTLPQSSYEIHIGQGILETTGEKLLGLGLRDKAVIVTNPLVNSYYSGILKAGLESAGFKTVILQVPDGEQYKSLQQAGELYRALSEHQAERRTPILALGGGVIGDLAGFVAATYLRGVPLVQVPTTLLAQVDSSTGGKVAVDYAGLKNIVGAFYQPTLVAADVSSLATLMENDYINGLAELIKHAIILDRQLFERLEQGTGLIRSRDRAFLEEVIFHSAGIKARIVEQDEKDLGLRNVLNYGHTFGHALETVSGFEIQHGSGVAIGMAAAALLSRRMGLLKTGEMQRTLDLISKAGLPVNHNIRDIPKIVQAMQYDKKRAGGKTRFVLLKGIGEVFLNDDVDITLVEEVLRDLYVETPNLPRIG